jgi:hypothetical protein
MAPWKSNRETLVCSPVLRTVVRMQESPDDQCSHLVDVDLDGRMFCSRCLRFDPVEVQTSYRTTNEDVDADTAPPDKVS